MQQVARETWVAYQRRLEWAGARACAPTPGLGLMDTPGINRSLNMFEML
jgi:hypothetical protein